MFKCSPTLTCLATVLAFCGGVGNVQAAPGKTVAGKFVATPIAQFNEPWAMTFLPDGRLLVTEKRGALKVYAIGGTTGDVSGVPKVAYGGQGGFADVVLHPSFESNQWVYLSYAEAGEGGKRGAAVARAKLTLNEQGGGALSNLDVIWRQTPKVEGQGHYGHRIAFHDGYLWITSGERQKFAPAQDMQANLGKVVRLKEDGSVPADNPFAQQGGVTAQIWTLGHRNPLGIAFDAQSRLWVHEMGPSGGDELNIIERGANYGYPVVSDGDHYNGRAIPDHSTSSKYKQPVVTWNPVISPAGFIIYRGNLFPDWKGSGFIGSLSSESLIRVAFDGTSAREAERFDMDARIREIEEGPDGAIWILEDGRSGGRLLKLTPPT